MIRLAEEKDVQSLVEMLVDFQAEAGCYSHIDPCKRSLTNFILSMLSSPATRPIFVFERKGVVMGGTALICEPSWFNDAQWSAQELFWYIKPEYRGRYGVAIKLFDKLESWCKERGMRDLTVACTATIKVEKLETFYTRKGFEKSDVFFTKRVN